MTGETSTPERLVAAAIPLIWRHGYGSVSVDAICRAAGAHKGSFYHAFPSKAALLVRAIDVIWARDGAELRALAAGPGQPVERLDRYLDWFLDNQRRLAGEMGFVPGHFHMAIDPNVPDAARVATEHRAEVQAILRALIAPVLAGSAAGADTADWLAATIGHLVSGLMIEARLANSLDAITALKPTVRRMLRYVAAGSDERSRTSASDTVHSVRASPASKTAGS